MSKSVTFDVFLSYSSKDKEIVRPLAERLRADGLRVWLDDWEIRPGDSIPAKIEKGAAHSNILRNEGGQMCGCLELTLSRDEGEGRPPTVPRSEFLCRTLANYSELG